jgi:HTH-type transcriptional regulator/antitoxin HigA
MDEAKYGELLKDLRPRIIETPEEHERLLSVAESLMEKGDELCEEEREALALVVLLIEAFEATIREDDKEEDDEDEDDDETPTPHVALARLMQSHGVEISDIAPIFGNPHIAREVLDGKRDISRSQARELGRYFRVPERLFRGD